MLNPKYLMCALLIICLAACNLERPATTPSVPVRDLILSKHQESFGSHGVISGMCLGMTWADGFLYVADHDGSRVLKMNGEFEEVTAIGSQGQGPGELQWVGYPTLTHDRLTVLNAQARMLVHFDTNGTYLGQTSVAHRAPNTRFAAFEELFFISWPIEDKAITAVGMGGEKLFEFGELQFTENFNEKRARNHKLLAMLQRSDQPVLIAVGETEPLLEVFDVKGQLLMRENLSSNPFLKRRLDEVSAAYRADPANREKAYLLFRDLAVSGHHLYALVSTSTPPYQILKFEIGAEAITCQEVWQIHDDVFIRNLAYDGGEGIYIYDGKSNEVGRYRFYEP